MISITHLLNIKQYNSISCKDELLAYGVTTLDNVPLGPVKPLHILPTNGPDDLYTIQNNNLRFAAKLAFSISPTSSAQPRDPFFSKVEKKNRGPP